MGEPEGHDGPSTDLDDSDGSVVVLDYPVLSHTPDSTDWAWIVEGDVQAKAVAEVLGASSTVVAMSSLADWETGLAEGVDTVVRGRKTIVMLLDDSTARVSAIYDAAQTVGSYLKMSGAAQVRYTMPPPVKGGAKSISDYLTQQKDPAGWLGDLAKAGMARPAATKPKTRTEVSVTAESLGVKIWDGPDLRVDTVARAILEKFPAAKLSNGEIAWYRDGVYTAASAGDRDLELLDIVGSVLGNRFTLAHYANIRARIQGLVHAEGQVIPDLLDEPIVNFKNGLYDLRTGELMPHTPEHLSTFQLAVEIDPEGQCPLYDEWIKDRCGAVQAEALDALMAATMDPTSTPHFAGFLFGPPRSGKSTALRLMTRVIGGDYVSGVTLQQLDSNRYAAAELYGKRMNVAADLPASHVKDLGLFKSLTGDDKVFADKKYGAAFSFVSMATMMFSANKIVTVSADEAYYARMVPIAFPRSFLGEEDKTLEKRLAAELPAVAARWARAYGKRPEALSAVRGLFRQESDRVARFVSQCCYVGDEIPSGMSKTSRSKIYELFSEWCGEDGGKVMSRQVFYNRLRDIPGVQETKVRGERVMSIAVLDPEDWDDAPDGVSALIPLIWPDADLADPHEHPDDDVVVGIERGRALREQLFAVRPRGLTRETLVELSMSEALPEYLRPHSYRQAELAVDRAIESWRRFGQIDEYDDLIFWAVTNSSTEKVVGQVLPLSDDMRALLCRHGVVVDEVACGLTEPATPAAAPHTPEPKPEPEDPEDPFAGAPLPEQVAESLKVRTPEPELEPEDPFAGVPLPTMGDEVTS